MKIKIKTVLKTIVFYLIFIGVIYISIKLFPSENDNFGLGLLLFLFSPFLIIGFIL